MPALAPLLGENLTAITIEAGTNNLGTVTYSAPQNIRAYISDQGGLGGQLRRDTENIRPIWRRQHNMVITGEGHYLDVACIQRSDSANILRQMANYDVARVTWTQGVETYTVKYTVATLEYGVRARGQNVNVLHLEPFDDGGFQATVSP